MRPADKFRFFLTFFLFFLYGILISQKINLVTADLGRHIKNGEMILQVFDPEAQTRRGDTPQKVLGTNLYSYTFPEFPFLNHHWGGGVVLYLVHQVSGFVGISIFFLIVSLVTLGLFFDVARKKSNFETAFLVTLLLLPLIADRVEIRPEIFSYLFCGIYLWILRGVRKVRKRLIILPFLQLLWVNLHVYFFLGLFLIGVFLAEEILLFLKKKDSSDLKAIRDLSIALFLSILASFLNPAGVKGLLYPFRIFGNYGYRILENQTVWFLDKIIQYPPNLYFKIGFGLLLLSWIFVFRKRRKFSFANFILSIFISYLGWTAVRNFTLFGLFALPIVASNLNGVAMMKKNEDNILKNFVISSLAVLIIFVLFLINIPYWKTKGSLGLGLEKGVEKGAEFFKKEKLRGPIFNDYDNGGYLIYYLYPQEKIFVDNRPEAYPKEFFDKVYIPMQENESVWVEVDKKYNFNTIFFHRLDLTPWSQTFLINRVSDPSWAPIYVDGYSIIFVKRNEQNKELIKKFELPKEMFSVTK